MSNTWRSIKELREIHSDISAGFYSTEYAKKHGLYEKNLSESFGTVPSVWVPEPIEVAIDENGETVYRTLKPGTWYEESKEKFETSLGTFISNNMGEFGGELITPKGRLSGNFVEVFECGGVTYAIDSLVHFSVAHIRIYAFTDNSDAIRLYDTESSNDLNFDVLNWISYAGSYIVDDTAYVLASGRIRNYSLDDDEWHERSYLFKLQNGKITEQTEFDRTFYYVNNILIKDGQLIIGLDKMVKVVDLRTKEMKMYTPIGTEAENDILKTSKK